MRKTEVNSRVRDRVRDVLRDGIVAGRFKGGEHLEEVGLASDLGISRTPLREALLGLEQEGLVISRPHRGFVVTHAGPEAVRELYPILGSLEALVVELSADALQQDVPELRAINRRLAGASIAKAAAADQAFHAALRRRCTNRRLLDMLHRHETIAHRLDGAIRRGMADVAGSRRQHDCIVDAIDAGDRKVAVEAMRDHWRQGEAAVLAWLEQNGPR